MEESRDMKYEQVRLGTFSSWPANAKVEAWKMAKAGLLYTGQEELVKCTFCDCLLTDWQYGDQVMSRHRMANPSCPFVQNQSDNVPLGNQGNLGNLDPTVMGEDEEEEMEGGGVESQEYVDDVGIDTSRLGLTEEDYSPGSSPMEISEVLRAHSEMKSEARRLASFSSWSTPYIRPEDLAKAGFYYVNQRDNCRCAFCENFVGDWEEGDVPMEEHAKLFPLCAFVRGVPVGNIPLQQGEESGSSSNPGTSSGHDETGLRWNRLPNSRPEKGFPCAQRGYSESLGIISHTGPLHPSYATPEARLRTFREWPPALKQRPQELADAGFYYIGLSDQVKCFYCDGGLRNWQPEDDPWMEHARWFSKCVFVRLRKGDEYIQECLESRPPDSSQEAVPAQSREVTEDDIRAVMSEALVRQVLSMGIDHSRVKMAIKKQLEQYGAGFDTPEHLINAAFSVQRNQERRVNMEQNNPSGAVLGGRRSFDEVTSRRWEEELVQSGDLTEDEEETFTSLPAGVNLTRPSPSSSSTPSTYNLPLPTPSTSIQSSSAPSTPAPSTSKSVPAPTIDPAPAPALAAAATAGIDESLEDENARLKEQRTCKVCMDGEVGVVFLPCGHLICCVSCAPSLKDCPVCRSNIQGTVRTFLS